MVRRRRQLEPIKNIYAHNMDHFLLDLFNGRFTKIYPKFHLTREFFTKKKNIILVLTFCLNFSLFLRGCANFSLYGLNFSLSCADARISHFLV
jgi:hypothetical protein